eukprot:gene5948-8197_t
MALFKVKSTCSPNLSLKLLSLLTLRSVKTSASAYINLFHKTNSKQKPHDIINRNSFKTTKVSHIHAVKQENQEIVKVITDIDDTIVSSGGVRLFGIPLGGIDNQYIRGQFYPGVIQFALELSLPKEKKGPTILSKTKVKKSFHSNHHNNNNNTLLGHQPIIPPKVSVLTARAREFKFALELKSNGKLCSAYRNMGHANGINDWGIGDVYYGSVAEWIFQHRKGIRKFKNFEKMVQEDIKNNSGMKYVLIGDTGEKDEDAGERMAMKYPNKMKAIFLHAVYDRRIKKKVFGSLNNLLLDPGKIFSSPSMLPKDRVVNGVPILYFRTYVGAAIKAYQHNLITKEGLRRIANQAIYDILNPSYSKSSSISSSSSSELLSSVSNYRIPSLLLKMKQNLIHNIRSIRLKISSRRYNLKAVYNKELSHQELEYDINMSPLLYNVDVKPLRAALSANNEKK